MTEPDNLTLVLLREIRADVRASRDEMRALEHRTNARFDSIEKRLDAMHLNGMKALKGFIGHRTMVERTMASFDDQVSRLETRVAALEAARA
jgi:hypothetical protein